ncbi:hypothetical protein AB0C29_01420 [Actinoplanes sp. NPDC048791]
MDSAGRFVVADDERTGAPIDQVDAEARPVGARGAVSGIARQPSMIVSSW